MQIYQNGAFYCINIEKKQFKRENIKYKLTIFSETSQKFVLQFCVVKLRSILFKRNT